MAKKPINVTIRKASSAPPSEFRIDIPMALYRRLVKQYPDRDIHAVIGDILEKHLHGLEQQPEVSNDPVSSLVKWVQASFSRVASLKPAWLF
jgi:hypothetical protein